MAGEVVKQTVVLLNPPLRQAPKRWVQPIQIKISHMGKLAEIKTKQTSASVAGFIDSIPDEQKCLVLK